MNTTSGILSSKIKKRTPFRFRKGLQTLAFVFSLAFAGCGDNNNDNTAFTNQLDNQSSPTVVPTKLDAASARKIKSATEALDSGQLITKRELDELVKVALKYPHSDQAVSVVCHLYESWKDYGGLAEFLKQLPPNNERADYLTFVLIKDDQFEAAISLLEALLKQRPDDHLLQWRMGNALSHAGRNVEAIEFIRRAMPTLQGEELVEAHNLIGQSHLSKNELDLAEQHFKQALAVDQTTLQALIGLMAIYERMGETEKARVYQEQSLRVRNERAQEKLKSGLFAIKMRDLKKLLDAEDWNGSESLIAEIKTDAAPDQLAHLNRVSAMITQKKASAGTPK